MKYISFTNWEDTQHYKYRNNPWIRLYTDIIEEYDKNGKNKKFYNLKDLSRANFLCLLCLANKYNNNIPYKSNEGLKRSTGLKKIYLTELVECNYIVIKDDASKDASKLLAKVAPTCTKNATTVTVTGTVTDTEYSSFELPDKKTINESSIPQIKKFIDQMSDKLYYEKVWVEAPKYKNTMLKRAKNPRAVLYTLIQIYKKKPKQPWGYCQQILKVEDGNYNEQDFRNEHDVNEDVMPPEKLQELAGQFLKGME